MFRKTLWLVVAIISALTVAMSINPLVSQFMELNSRISLTNSEGQTVAELSTQDCTNQYYERLRKAESYKNTSLLIEKIRDPYLTNPTLALNECLRISNNIQASRAEYLQQMSPAKYFTDEVLWSLLRVIFFAALGIWSYIMIRKLGD